MTEAKTAGNQGETLSDITEHQAVMKTLDHLDSQLHDLDRKMAGILEFIAEHRPALARGLALMDPGAKVRSMLPGRKAKP